MVQLQCYELIPRPNQLRVKDSFTKQDQGVESDIFWNTQEDNDVSLSCEDQRFLEIIEVNIHRNDDGNWEMPLPFRLKDVKIPNSKTLRYQTTGVKQ